MIKWTQVVNHKLTSKLPDMSRERSGLMTFLVLIGLEDISSRRVREVSTTRKKRVKLKGYFQKFCDKQVVMKSVKREHKINMFAVKV